MTVSIMQAGPDDAAEIYDVEVALFPHDAWSRATVDSELSHPDSYYLVLRHDQSHALVGYGGLRAPKSSGGQGDIQTMAVDADYQGRGLGAMLLDALLAEAWRRNVDDVFLEVRADNEVAKALYDRAGFREIARRPGYYQPGSIDAIVMRKTRNDRENTDE
jgi:[ribosomal protein S18]-alanine N-acetyltransferase